MTRFTLLGLFLLLSVSHSYAAECYLNGNWLPINSVTNVRVSIVPTSDSSYIELRGYDMQCKFAVSVPQPGFEDYWYTQATGYAPGPKFTAYGSGLTIQGTRHATPAGNVYIATMPYNGGAPRRSLNTFAYVKTSGSPGNPINIKAGDLIGQIYVYQNSNRNPGGARITLRLIADKDFGITPSTCTINNNQPINVDFGTLDGLNLGESTSTTTARKTVTLNYSCPSPGITQPIKISFLGGSASFNNNYLAMSKPELGVGLERNGSLVNVGGNFLTSITNSTGHDDVVFALVRKNGADPGTGSSTGSAVLVMGVP